MLVFGLGLCTYGYVLFQLPYVDGTPGLALVPGCLLVLVGIIVLIVKLVAG